MRRAHLLIAATAVLCTLPPALPAAAAKPDHRVRERVSRILLAYGGWGRLVAVRAYRLEGEVFSAMRHEAVPTTRVFARPDRLKTLIDYPGGIEARILDGRRGWRMTHGAPLQEAAGPMLLSMELQAARSAIPWILAERESVVRLIEPRVENGVKLPGLEIPLREGLVLRVWTNPVTQLVEVSEGALRTAGAFAHFANYYSDFREVNGVKFPFREENFASGTQTGVTTVERVIVNPPISPGEFTPPAPPDSAATRPRGRVRG